MSEKIYVWSGKTITTKYGDMLWISFNRTDLQKMMDNLNEKDWINLNVAPRKDVGKYGETQIDKIVNKMYKVQSMEELKKLFLDWMKLNPDTVELKRLETVKDQMKSQFV